MAATANPLGSRNNDRRPPMLGREAPRAPVANIAAKTHNHLVSSALEERSTRSNALTTGLSRRVPPIGRLADAYTVNPIEM
jgi:hypothetical protein